MVHYRTIRLEWEELVSISQPPLYDLLHGIYTVRMNVMLKHDTVFMLLYSVYHIFENLVATVGPPSVLTVYVPVKIGKAARLYRLC